MCGYFFSPELHCRCSCQQKSAIVDFALYVGIPEKKVNRIKEDTFFVDPFGQNHVWKTHLLGMGLNSFCLVSGCGSDFVSERINGLNIYLRSYPH